MKRPQSGKYTIISTVGGEPCKAFIPNPLPPQPELQIDVKMQTLLDEALLSLGRLDSISTLLPDTQLFIYMYVRKEAVLSSQIEGTQSSLSDLLKHEGDVKKGVPVADIREVSNYVSALEHGLQRLREGFPISLRLIRELHGILLQSGRGSFKDPGEFRKSQNWIGGTRPGNAVYVPPPPDELIHCLSDFEAFLHDKPTRLPVLIKIALAHVQFESIHPFLDGNGRVGRLLITLLLCWMGVLCDPTLYLSLYFKTNRSEYYDLLQNVRVNGEWEKWLKFFLKGVVETANSAIQTAKSLVEIFEKDRQKIQAIGLSAGSALRVHHALQQFPISRLNKLAQMTKLSYPTVKHAVEKLVELKLVSEVTGLKRGKLYCYDQYLNILNEGTQL